MKKLVAVFAALAIIFSLAACTSKPVVDETTTNPTEAPATEPVTLDSSFSSFGSKDDYKHACYLEIIQKDGSSRKYGVYAKEDSLGKSLSAMGIIAGEEGPYGLMIKSVLGVEHIYETSGYVWMVYANGEQSQVGIDSIMIEDGATYTLKVETF